MDALHLIRGEESGRQGHNRGGNLGEGVADAPRGGFRVRGHGCAAVWAPRVWHRQRDGTRAIRPTGSGQDGIQACAARTWTRVSLRHIWCASFCITSCGWPISLITTSIVLFRPKTPMQLGRCNCAQLPLRMFFCQKNSCTFLFFHGHTHLCFTRAIKTKGPFLFPFENSIRNN